MRQFYLRVEQIEAYPAPNPNPRASDQVDAPGYMVIYPNGYQSWLPKAVFEAAYLPMGEGNDGSRVTDQMVDDFIASYEDAKLGQATTMVVAHLRNGFTVVGSAGTAEPANYDHDLGVRICKDRIKPEVRKLLGFLLACGRNGIAQGGGA